MTDQPASTAPLAAGLPLVQGRCPACGTSGLFLGDGGYITCSTIDCPRPDLVNELIGEIADSRQHGAFVFCGHHIGYATMREFAVKITEKVTAVGQRKEAVAYANEQKQRAEAAEAAIARVQDAAALHRKQLVSTAELYAVIEAALAEQREQSARTTEKNPATSSDMTDSPLRRLRTQLAAERDKARRADEHPRPDLDDLRVTPHNGIAAGLEIALFYVDHHLREAGEAGRTVPDNGSSIDEAAADDRRGDLQREGE